MDKQLEYWNNYDPSKKPEPEEVTEDGFAPPTTFRGDFVAICRWMWEGLKDPLPSRAQAKRNGARSPFADLSRRAWFILLLAIPVLVALLFLYAWYFGGYDFAVTTLRLFGIVLGVTAIVLLFLLPNDYFTDPDLDFDPFDEDW